MVFVPPDAPSSAVVDALAAKATDLWADVETTLLARLGELTRGDMNLGDVNDRLRLVRELRATVQDALAAIPEDAAQQLVDAASAYGAANALVELAGLPGTPYSSGAPLGAAHLHGLVNTATDLVSRWDDVKNRVLRFPEDVYQRFGAQAVAERLGAATATQTQQLDLIKRWYGQGIPAFTDVSGRTWRAGSYIEMATRTGTQRALTEGRRAQMTTAGVRLGQIREAAAACDVCAPWHGALVSLDQTPAGPVTMLSAVDDEAVTVQVQATI
ncbi:MAG: phage minor capsid protein, partial [Pseudoclavibacter sp.]